MMHPFMPYVTEELWQRLPRRPNDPTQTICKAPYPRYTTEFDNEKAEKDYDLVFAVVKAIRSLASEYGIKDKAEVYVLSSDPETFSTLSSQTSSISALVKVLESLVAVGDDKDIPHGCSANVVSKKCGVYLMVKGRVDVDAEISKAQKKIGKLRDARKRLEKTMGVRDYQTKVKPEVQEVDKRKLADYVAEEKTLEELVARFEGLRA